MNWPYMWAPNVWLSLLTAILLIALSVYSWRRGNIPGALPFALASLFTGLWAAGSFFESMAVAAEVKILWVKFEAVWQMPAVTAITCFVIEYTWPGRFLKRGSLLLLSILPLLNAAMIVTNDLHHLVWQGFGVAEGVVPEYGLGGWLFLAYLYGLGMVNLLVFAWLFVRAPQQLTLNQLLCRARIEWHGVELGRPDWSHSSHSLAFTLASLGGRFRVHAMLNAWREPLRFALPAVEGGWRRWIDTSLAGPEDIVDWEKAPVVAGADYPVEARSLALLVAPLAAEGAAPKEVC